MNDVHVINLDKTMKASFRCIDCGWKGELEVPEKISSLVFADRQNCPHCRLDSSLRPVQT